MNSIADAVFSIRNESSYNTKLYLLERFRDMPGFKEILHFIYNPYCKTGISNSKLDKALSRMEGSARQVSWEEVIEYFKRHQTGSDADAYMAATFVTGYSGLARELAKAIVTQDLQIGITATSLNKAYGKNFIPKIGCMLGTLYGDVPAAKVQWPCIVTEKLDGIRRILVKQNGVVRCYSRSGHEDTDLVEIIKEAKFLPDNTVYDGELLAAGTFKDNIEQRQATSSIANSKGPKVGLIYNVFDMLPASEFFANGSTDDALTRKILIAATFMDESLQILRPDDWATLIQAFGIHTELKTIKPVPILAYAKNMSDVQPIVEDIWAQRKEGVMLNTSNGLYKIKRSKELLKIKFVTELLLKVVDVQEGTGKYEDSLGALIVEYKGNRVGVGSGFTDGDRKIIWLHPEVFIGKTIEVETFGESTNAAGEVSINCPIFKRFVGVEE